MEDKICEYNDKMPFDYRCTLAWFCGFLYDIQLHYICMVILALIIYISIFGNIKANYRWFILNQAVWDACVSFDFYCGSNYGSAKCFYRVFLSYAMWKIILLQAINYIFLFNCYPAFFILTLSRFLCLYFTSFYEKVTKGFRLLFFFILFTTISLSITLLLSISQAVSMSIFTETTTECRRLISLGKSCPFTPSQGSAYKFWQTCANVIIEIDKIKGLVCIIGALIPGLFIVRKISSQFRFQLKNNRKDFYASFRIALVLTIQWILNAIMLLLETVYSRDFGGKSDENGNTFLSVLIGIATVDNIQAFRQIRVFLECLAVMTLMTGYRENVFKFFKWIFGRYKKDRISPAISGVRSSGMLFIDQR